MSDKSTRYLCIHGHFYQPPRENPWLEAVEVQDSASPYHDWNERITRECYAPNSRSRLLDDKGRIAHLLNNYAWMSFNFGPTLLSWMADNAPRVLHRIIEGDRLSQERRGGHGNALAQVFNHIIMPLAGARDRRTQILWGLADFRLRFGREPEGMWLAETAVDTASLEDLAEAGIKFTILSPRQARRWRPITGGDWTELSEGVDPSRAYACILPSGRSITLFFYDGVISRQVAFEGLLTNGEKFLNRLMGGFDNNRKHPQLVHIATDGESYGHHHAHGDMALADALNRLVDSEEIQLTNYGEFLELHPPEWQVEIHENSSWSCAHGVERWRSNCSCRMSEGWQQEWRGPLRDALNFLKDQLDSLFEKESRGLLQNPWPARDDYIDVILNRSKKTITRFIQTHAIEGIRDNQIPRLLRLLEMQRNGLLMFTSCGWFFDELSGIETVQCMQYAARAIQLARRFGEDYEEAFLEILGRAQSNLPRYDGGRGVWNEHVKPAQVDLERVVAHYAISLIYRQPEERAEVYTFDLEVLDRDVRNRGVTHVAVGKIHVRSQLTWNELKMEFIVVHYGGLDFHTVLRRSNGPDNYEEIKKKIFEAYETDSLAVVTTLVSEKFGGEVHQLDDLFVDEQRRIAGIVLKERVDEYQRAFEKMADQDEPFLSILSRIHSPIPKPIRAAVSTSLDHRVITALEHLDDPTGRTNLDQLIQRGQSLQHTWDVQPIARTILNELQHVIAGLNSSADLSVAMDQAESLLDAARQLEIPLDLWQIQNHFLDSYVENEERGAMSPNLHQTFAKLAVHLNIRESLLGWRP